MKLLLRSSLINTLLFTGLKGFTQEDTTHHELKEIVITSSRIPESIITSPVSIDRIRMADIKNLPTPSFYDGMEYLRGVQVITPSLGFRVINTRGFANTTNVRFTQLIDGIDNQAPHLGAPIANALGAGELDIYSVEIIPGVASALYGMNAVNGLANIRTKNPFEFEGASFQQLTGMNHLGNTSSLSPQLFSTSNLRYAQKINEKFAVKINLAYTHGTDWEADNYNDLAPSVNSSVDLTGFDNPAFDEVNSYGNESSNRKTLTLNGKKYVVARTGYRETDFADYGIDNYKGDAGIYFRPALGHEISLTGKSALINTIYQRSNRFRLEDYKLSQFALDYHSDYFQIRSYLTLENTGNSYNLRSLAENMDRAYKTDSQWFADYTTEYNNAVASGLSDADAHKYARNSADAGRYEPGTASWNQKQNELTQINNWDYGAALRVRSQLYHAEGIITWNKLFPSFFEKINSQLQSGFDYRNYVIVPDGNYFINPQDSSENLNYSKAGMFTQVTTGLFKNKIKISATIRADKADYFTWKFNPRIGVVYLPADKFSIRTSYQSGYRFPSIFEGFSNVNSGGVKR
ncbi:MAG: TonB-dependent receptor, partial [Crocinitomicaceae bacterium]|nr:TonB-dependent receptor [Crocinitomicaceae bacterium]